MLSVLLFVNFSPMHSLQSSISNQQSEIRDQSQQSHQSSVSPRFSPQRHLAPTLGMGIEADAATPRAAALSVHAAARPRRAVRQPLLRREEGALRATRVAAGLEALRARRVQPGRPVLGEEAAPHHLLDLEDEDVANLSMTKN